RVATAISLRPLSAPGASPFTKRGPPSSEVTVVICRVPWPEFSQAPEDFLLAHLCRFTVRAPHGSTTRGAFLGSGASVASGHTATASALVEPPPLLPVWLRRRYDAPLPLLIAKQSEASVRCLSPVSFSAQPRLTSELLRFL